jgi:hypothetical protein
MTVSVTWDTDAPITAQPNAGSLSKVYTAGTTSGTVTVTDEAIGGESVTRTFTVPLEDTTVSVAPTSVDSADSVAADRTVTVAGSGFPASTAGTVAIATGAAGAYGTTVVSTAALTNASGIFTGVELVVPLDTAAGTYHIEAMFASIGDLDEALTIINNPLDQPVGLNSPAQTSTTVDLAWTAVTDADQYIMRWSPTGAGTWTEVAAVLTNSGTVTGLAPSTTYDFGVKAEGAGFSDSPWSATITQATDAPPVLATPANLAAGVPTTTTVPLTWDAVTSAETYTVSWRETPAGPWTDITGIVLTNHTVTGLDPLTDYEFRVKAEADGFTDSAWSTSDTATTASLGTLAAPTGIASPSQTATTIDLTWTAVANATSYGIERSPAGAGTWVEVQTAATNAATVTGMTASTSYDFRIAARADGWTASAWSATFTQATTA